MRNIVRPTPRRRSALVAAALAVTLASLAVSEAAHAGTYFQRRGRMIIPQRPVNVDSSPMVDDLNKALKAIGQANHDPGGHLDKAVKHIHAAMSDLAVPTATAKGKGDAAPAPDHAASAAPAVPEADSIASLRKARATLFALHHKLTDKASTRGRIHADAEVRIAIQEIDLALKSNAPAATPAPAPAHASISATPGK
jgi:hypothetical protein